MTQQSQQKYVYCHFSFRRPKDKHYGIFAVALYSDVEGKILVAAKTRAFTLWKDHQHVSAIQAYEHALYCLWEWQYKLKQHGVTNILLVTDNSTLAGWIADPKKNKEYTSWMVKAYTPYKVGGAKEIMLPVGLCEPREAEKSHKYCTEDKISNTRPPERSRKAPSGYKLPVTNYKSALEIVDEDKPEGLDISKPTPGSVFID